MPTSCGINCELMCMFQLKGNRRKNSNLERAVLVLRRLVEKLQAENKRLLQSRTSQTQDKVKLLIVC